MDNQINEIRARRHADFLKNTDNIPDNIPDKKSAINLDESKKLLRKDDSKKTPYKIASNKIALWAKSLLKKCINDEDIKHIPGIYRYRMTVRNTHKILFDDRKISDRNKIMYQFMYSTIADHNTTVLFNYCIDIRNYVRELNNPIIVNNEYYFLQPLDREMILNIWKKVNNETTYSIRFVTDMKYYRSLAIDMYKIENINK